MLHATRITLCLLAQRIEQLTGQIRALDRRLARLVERHFPQLPAPVGIGPDSERTATLMVTMGDNPERLHSEASFAALCGVSPIEHRAERAAPRRSVPNAALNRDEMEEGATPFRPAAVVEATTWIWQAACRHQAVTY